MTNAVSIIRGLLIYSICIPLAIFLGYVLAHPMDRQSMFGVALVFGCLVLPLLMRLHHPALVLTWNMTAVIFLFPGRPNIWMALAGVSLLFTFLHYIVDRRFRPQSIPSLTRPLLVLATFIFATAMLTGGIGFKALGSEVGGGKRYLQLGAAIIGYFALSAIRVPPERANRYVAMFFLGGLTLAIGSLPYFLPAQLHFIYLIFPADSWAYYSRQEALSSFRGYGIAMSGVFTILYLLARYGINELFSLRHPFRIVPFAVGLVIMLWGGYRSFMLLVFGVFFAQFYLEGLHRSRKFPVFVLGALLAGAGCVAFSTHLPYSIQRALSIFGLPVSSAVQMDVTNSNEWRVRMWRQVSPQIPEYLIVGKGYGIDVRDLETTTDMMLSRRALDSTESAVLAQDYHNGPLSVILPLGVGGVIIMLWFWAAGIRALVQNYRYGLPGLRHINSLLLALFLVKIVHFFLIFGALNLDLAMFTGILGLSMALNGGIARASSPVKVQVPTAAKPGTLLPPPTRPAFGQSVSE